MKIFYSLFTSQIKGISTQYSVVGLHECQTLCVYLRVYIYMHKETQ